MKLKDTNIFNMVLSQNNLHIRSHQDQTLLGAHGERHLFVGYVFCFIANLTVTHNSTSDGWTFHSWLNIARKLSRQMPENAWWGFLQNVHGSLGADTQGPGSPPCKFLPLQSSNLTSPRVEKATDYVWWLSYSNDRPQSEPIFSENYVSQFPAGTDGNFRFPGFLILWDT